MIINKRKNRQIQIDKKPPNLVGTEEENRSAGSTVYYIFVFLFRVLVAASRPRFCLEVRDRVIRGQTI